MRSLCRLGLAAGFALGVGCNEAPPQPTQGADAGADRDAGAPEPQCKRWSDLREPFFGDLHVHTALSLDANLQGTRLRPMDAYRFARGEEAGLPPYDEQGEPSRRLKLERPLDFVAVSDHAEFLGLVTTCLTPGLEGYDSASCEQYRERPDNAFFQLNSRLAEGQAEARFAEPCTRENAYCGSAALSAWSEVREAAEAANDASGACEFTAFIAYEWSASPGLKNLHRNVIFRNGVVPKLPFSYFDGSQEEQLWSALERDCTSRGDGCDALTIPHNSNLSAGLMFEPVDANDEPIDAEYARKRADFEPLLEVFQHKGASECLPQMGPDELCSFEVMPYNDLGSVTLGGPADDLLSADFARDALGRGLALEASLGENPFAYGFVASTDTHLGIAGAVDERTFPGHGGAGSDARTTQPKGLVDNVWLNPGGLAVLWAEENSRDALFRAMRRREAYATSGPRMVLRFFGGFGYDPGLCGAKNFVKQGYEGGVPMGGVLPAAEGATAPRFAVWAMRDPGTQSQAGLPLQRVQIIKGWLEGGKVKYAIYDVAGDAESAASVDPVTCEPVGKGADELCAVWEDPAFDAAQPAFYYARVLENPSCRWHAIACADAAVDCSKPQTITEGYEGCCTGQAEAQQERAWSSPIFYRAR